MQLVEVLYLPNEKKKKKKECNQQKIQHLSFNLKNKSAKTTFCEGISIISFKMLTGL